MTDPRYVDDPFEDEPSGPRRPKWSIPTRPEEIDLLSCSRRKYWPANDDIRHKLIMIIDALQPMEMGTAENPVEWPREWWDKNMEWALEQDYLPVKAIHTLMTNEDRLNSFRARWYAAAADERAKITVSFSDDGGAYV